MEYNKWIEIIQKLSDDCQKNYPNNWEEIYSKELGELCKKYNPDVDWNKTDPIGPHEAHINPPPFQRLRYNILYEEMNPDEIKIGEKVVIGTYASDSYGGPSIRWREIVVDQPIREYCGFIAVLKKNIKYIRKEKLKRINGTI